MSSFSLMIVNLSLHQFIRNLKKFYMRIFALPNPEPKRPINWCNKSTINIHFINVLHVNVPVIRKRCCIRTRGKKPTDLDAIFQRNQHEAWNSLMKKEIPCCGEWKLYPRHNPARLQQSDEYQRPRNGTNQ